MIKAPQLVHLPTTGIVSPRKLYTRLGIDDVWIVDEHFGLVLIKRSGALVIPPRIPPVATPPFKYRNSNGDSITVGKYQYLEFDANDVPTLKRRVCTVLPHDLPIDEYHRMLKLMQKVGAKERLYIEHKQAADRVLAYQKRMSEYSEYKKTY